LLPLINADERGFSERNIFVFDQRSSAFISGQLGFLIFQQAPIHVWSNRMRWAVSNPEKRRALAQLGLSDEITPRAALRGIRRWQASANCRKGVEPMARCVHSKVGFDAIWRVVAGFRVQLMTD
jgi:hypothetical protein